MSAPQAGALRRVVHTLNRGGQDAALADTSSRVLVLQGGWRSGKTHALACKVLQLARLNPGVRGLFAAPTWDMVEQVFVVEVQKLCERLGIRCVWHGSKHTLSLFARHPVTVVCRSLDRPRSGEGLTVAWAVVDEWELCHPKALKTVNARITKGRAVQLVLGGTPEGYGPGYALILKEPRKGTRVIRLSTTGNRDNIGESYIEDTAALLDEQEQLEKLEGIRQARGGNVYRRLNRARVFGPPCVTSGELQVWADFNVGAQCWFLVEVDRDGKRAHVLEEVIGYELDTDQQAGNVIAAIARRLDTSAANVRGMGIRLVGDSSMRNRGAVGSHARIVAQHGFRPLYSTSGNPDVEDRILSVNLMLADERPALTIDEKRCPFLAQAITQQGRLPNGQPEKKADPREDLSGPNDAIGYGVFWWWPAFRYRPNTDPQAPADKWARAKERQTVRHDERPVLR